VDISKLIEVMAHLRDPQAGCPWDLQQDFQSIAPYTIEEAYEVADAIERGDHGALQEELGDLLLQVVYHARMAEELKAFDFGAVVESIVTNMIRRQPHVFSTGEVADADQQTELWEAMKASERGGGVLDGIPRALPASVRADKLGKRAARVGFDWPTREGARAKVAEELAELDQACQSGSDAHRAHELGDLLFSVVQLGRHLGLDSEACLRAASRRFQTRFESVEAKVQARGGDWSEQTPQQLDLFWTEAKAELKQ
jgi:ATP diphosphatase